VKYFIAFCGLVLVSCSVVDVEDQTPLHGMTIEQAWCWIDKNITFKSDFIDDFQLPETTFILRTGDCDDFSILLMSVMNEQKNYPPPELVCFSRPEGWHYAVKWNGEYYEPQDYIYFYDEKTVENNFLWSYSYEKSLSMAH